ncbi:MAG: RNA polymerase subunit sigma-24 [Candidatus Margulisbacteria bacterium GWF2_35_9]|nr:MAG: RNA polymerase subunit sigma-24 [Candidatus Margulisbacteria bacterium GWF2_35_9]
MELSDLDIVNRCKQGDHYAFSILVSRYKNLVFSVVSNMINDQNETNDMAQEVFIKMYKSIHKYNPDYKFSTWAVKMTTNLCIDSMRKKEATQVSIENAYNVASKEDTPEEKMVKKEKTQRINKLVSALPKKYRVPLILFHKNNLSYEEIVKVVNRPMSIVKNRLYRARLMLKEVLIQEREEGLL